MILIDLQKAFDTIDHDLLLKKMKVLGFSVNVIKWFKSYLSHRNFRVKVNKTLSDDGEITCGVPQGSILGPLLFLLYVNDMPQALSCDLLLYADDLCLVFQDKSINKIENKLNENLSDLCDWFVDKIMPNNKSNKQKTNDDEILILRQELSDLKARVDSLEETVVKLDSKLAISTRVNEVLRTDLDRLHQYTRRSCLVIHGIPTNVSETETQVEEKVRTMIAKDLQLDDNTTKDIITDIDKAHRIGKRNDNNQQAVIVRFKSHSKRTIVYRQRPKAHFVDGSYVSPNIKIRPSLTPYRIDVLENARKMVENIPDIAFVFADVFWDLKARVKTNDGHIIKGFTTLDDLSHLIHGLDYNSDAEM